MPERKPVTFDFESSPESDSGEVTVELQRDLELAERRARRARSARRTARGDLGRAGERARRALTRPTLPTPTRLRYGLATALFALLVFLLFTGGGEDQKARSAAKAPSADQPAAAAETEDSAGGRTPLRLSEQGLLRAGDRSPAVKGLQQALAAAGFSPGARDGAFGRSTKKAVKAFQKANGLPTDGIVGPATARALNKALADAA